MYQSRRLELESDYAFRPSPKNPFPGIPEEYHEGLADGSLELVLRRSATPNTWSIVKAQPAPDRQEAWPISSILCSLDQNPELTLFVRKDDAIAVAKHNSIGRTRKVVFNPGTAYAQAFGLGASFSAEGMPLWSRLMVDKVKFLRQQKRRTRAEKAAASFNRLAGTRPRAVKALSDEALAVLVLRRHREREATVWMYRSLERAVTELVQAGHAKVSADGFVDTNPAAVEEALVEWARRELNLKWMAPRHLRKRIEATLRPRKWPLPKEPELLYPMEDLWTNWDMARYRAAMNKGAVHAN